MIKYNPKSWQLLFIFKGILIKKLFGGMFAITFITAILCLLHLRYNIINISISTALPGYMGAALGLLLVFRNNSAYDKWWEARKEVGGLVNTTRNIAITLSGLLPDTNVHKIKMAKLLVAFTYAMKEHLRDGVKMNELQGLDGEEIEKIQRASNKPNIIADLLLHRIYALAKQGILTDMQQYVLIDRVNGLIDIFGRCERIKNTPIPMAYAVLLKFFIVVYVMVLPLGLINELGWYTIPLVITLYYILMSIVITAEEIEEPFGKDLNDISMDEISHKIKVNIFEIIKEKPALEGMDKQATFSEVRDKR